MTDLVWVSVWGHRGHGNLPRYHRNRECYRRVSGRHRYVPTTEGAALAAGMVPCAICAAPVVAT